MNYEESSGGSIGETEQGKAQESIPRGKPETPGSPGSSQGEAVAEMRCTKCKMIYPLTWFSKTTANRTGVSAWCRGCTRMMQRLAQDRINQDPIKHEEYLRRKRESSARRRAKNYPTKGRAHYLVKKALHKGELTKQPCVRCGDEAEAHHEDYTKPLEVVWLCKVHHAERHIEINKQTAMCERLSTK